MPNRMIRDWTGSEKMDLVSSQSERFFVRLIMKADDFGCYTANVKMLRSHLFPLKDDVRDIDIAKWVDECHAAGLITVYSVQGKKYLQIVDFGQRLRTSKSKFPLPHEADSNPRTIVSELRTDDSKAPPELETEYEVETEVENELEGARENSRLTVWPTFDDFWEKYDKKVDRPKCEKKWKKLTQGAREKIMQHLEEYIRGTPDKQYRKNPATYLNNGSWENEIIQPNGTAAQLTDKNRQHGANLVAALQRDRAKLFENGPL